MKNEKLNTNSGTDEQVIGDEQDLRPTMNATQNDDRDDEDLDEALDDDAEDEEEDDDDDDDDGDYTILPSNDAGITADDNAATGKMHEKEGE